MATTAEIIAKIDAAIGAPCEETDEEHDLRVAWVTRETLRRRLSHDIGKK